MTSKESIKTLNKIADYLERSAALDIADEIRKCVKSINKDLEVLDILKECFQYNDYGQWYIEMEESDFDFRSECSKEEWDKSPQKKIKDWLRKNE